MSYDVITPTKYSFSPSIEKFNEACAILGHIGIFQLRKRSCLLVVFPTGASCAFNPSEKKFIRSSGSLKCCLFPTSRSEYPKIWCWRTWKVYVCPTTPPKKKNNLPVLVSSLLHWQIFLRSWWSRCLRQHLENGLAHLAARTPKRCGLLFQTQGCDNKLGTNHGNVLRIEIPRTYAKVYCVLERIMQGLLSNGTLTTANLPTKSECMSIDWAPLHANKRKNVLNK